MIADVIGEPTAFGIAYRRDQLDRDADRLLTKLTAECFAPVSPPPPTRVIVERIDHERLHKDAEKMMRRWRYTAVDRNRILGMSHRAIVHACDLTLGDYVVGPVTG